MKKRIDVEIKCNNEYQAADMLEQMAITLRNNGFRFAPCEVMELEDEDGDTMGFRYDVYDNTEKTDIYGNPIEEKETT